MSSKTERSSIFGKTATRTAKDAASDISLQLCIAAIAEKLLATADLAGQIRMKAKKRRKTGHRAWKQNLGHQ